MGLFDNLKHIEKAAEEAVGAHPDQVKEGLAKLGQTLDHETGGSHHDQIAKAEQQAAGYIERLQPHDAPATGAPAPPAPGAPAPAPAPPAPSARTSPGRGARLAGLR